MKIVIFTVDHVYANYLVKNLLEKYQRNIILIVKSEVILSNKTSINALKKYIQVSGLRYVIAQIIKLEIYKIGKIVTAVFGLRDSKFYSYEKISKSHGIKVIKSENVNNISFERTLKKLKPDLIVSVLFNQILKENLIRIPKNGVINFHPAFLPDYKGMSPVFWSLANKEKFSGMAVHFIDTGIDTGGIIKRKRIKIERNDSEDSLYWRSVKEGVSLLISAIRVVEANNVKILSNKGGRYFSLPSKDAVKRFVKQKRKFFDLNYYLFNN